MIDGRDKLRPRLLSETYLRSIRSSRLLRRMGNILMERSISARSNFVHHANSHDRLQLLNLHR